MIELWKEDKDCTGCAACYQVCPRAAITMKEDAYGFIFPKIDNNLCIECGACIRVCPMKRESAVSMQEPMAFALRHCDETVLANSSSGGAFTAIAQVFAEGDYVIFGASIDENLQVIHQAVHSIEKIDILRKSKYVQSNTQRCFEQVRKYLKAGNKVFFVGTPCQIAGLKAYLGTDAPKLLTCDLVCEGVQSQRFFDRYIQFEEKKYRSKVQQVEFRSKEKYGWERSSFILKFANGTQYDRICQTKDIPYMNSTLFQGGNRASCYHCRFDKLPRQGDFTIGDLWGWRQMTPDWDDNKGISLVLVNTEKAKAMLQKLEKIAEIRPIDLSLAEQRNPNIFRSTDMPAVREAYMEDVQRMTYEDLVKKWLKPRSPLRRFLSHIKFMLGK